MSPRPLTDAELVEAVKARAEHGSTCAAARALGISENAARNRLSHAAARGMMGTSPVLPGYAIKSVSSQIGADGSLEREWVKQAPEAGEAFVPPANHRIAGLSVLTNGEGREIARWTKTKSEPDAVDIAEAVKAAFDGWRPRAVPTPAPACDDDLATVLLLPDAHLGQLSWKAETGSDYDLRIAEDTITAAFQRLVDASPASKQAVVLGLGDLLHSDGYENTTAKSKNILDVDSRWPRVLQTATRLIISTVQAALKKHERVLLRILPGNHDAESAIAITLACSMYFSSDPRVTVDDDPSYFWFWEWGQTLIAGTHGDQTKMKDVPLMLASRKPEAWGRCRYKHAFTGHIHHASSIEAGGVIVESLQSPAASDAWHAKQGFSSGRSLTAVTYHREHGEIGRHKARIVN